MKTYNLSDLEKIFCFKSLDDLSLSYVANAHDAWEKKLEDAYQRGWITMEMYAKSLIKIDGMAKYLMSLVRTGRA